MFANFNLLIYLCKKTDIGTVKTLCKQILEEKIDTEVFGCIVESIIGDF